MHTLREWRTEANKRGHTRIAELCDYLQADERTHVQLATDWIRELTKDDPEHRDELVRWGKAAIQRMNDFWASDGKPRPDPSEVQFTFLRAPRAQEVVTT
jgi:rubrerythrin